MLSLDFCYGIYLLSEEIIIFLLEEEVEMGCLWPWSTHMKVWENYFIYSFSPYLF